MKLIYSNFLFTLCLCLLSFAGTSQVYVDVSAAGANNGSSWTAAYTDLQDGLNNVAMNGEVWVAAGTYNPSAASVPFVFPVDLKLYGGFNGTETMLSERDFTTNVTNLSGDILGDDTPGLFTTNRTDNAMHIMTLSNAITSATVISGFTFSGGNTATTGTDDDSRGGAILTFGAPGISDCTFKDNFSWFGALYARNAASSGTSITNCAFEANEGNAGAGVYAFGCSDLIIDNCSFLNNVAVNGGGMYLDEVVGGEVKNSMFTGNSASGTAYTNGGGGIYLFTCDDLAISDCSFSLNICIARRGAGINTNNSNTTVTNSSFINNSAAASTSGGIQVFSDEAKTVTIENCEFIGNDARWGGAVTTYDATSTTIIKNSTFQNNTTISRGGGVYMGFGSRTEIENCEFTSNTVVNGGGAVSGQSDFTSCQMIGCEFKNNGPTDGSTISGGAVAMYGGMTTDIEDCYFEANVADFGGAITVVEDSVDIATLNISNSIIQVNIVTTQAGGINIAGAETLIENCIIANNVNTGVAGGGISVNSGGVRPTTVTIVNSSLVDNTAPLGAGVASFQGDDSLLVTTQFQNVILDNAGTNYEIEEGNTVATSLGGNLSTDESTDAFFQANDVNAPDPMFVDRDEFDYHLLDGSPCINAGVDAGAPATDIEGTPRVGVADIGAFEFDGMSSTQTVEGLGTLSIFPNPVRQDLNFNFESELNGVINISITDLRSRAYNQAKLQKNEAGFNSQINVSELSSGIYFLNITLADKNIATRFMKL